jgi:hypothetical protein
MTTTTLASGLTLQEEMESFNRKMEHNDAKTRKLKRELLGIVKVEAMTAELQCEFTRSKLNIPPHIWDEYDVEIKGKAIATEIVKSNFETLERFYNKLESNNERKSSNAGK